MSFIENCITLWSGWETSSLTFQLVTHAGSLDIVTLMIDCPLFTFAHCLKNCKHILCTTQTNRNPFLVKCCFYQVQRSLTLKYKYASESIYVYAPTQKHKSFSSIHLKRFDAKLAIPFLSLLLEAGCLCPKTE
jgi:hypothetical protein